MLALPIFPARLQASIFGRSELNFRVRNGNGWTLALISTNLLSFEKESKQRKLYTSFYKKRSVPFSLLTIFFNSKYSIKFSSHCQELFVLDSAARRAAPKSQTSEAFAIWNEKINGAQVSFRPQPEANRAQFIFEW